MKVKIQVHVGIFNAALRIWIKAFVVDIVQWSKTVTWLVRKTENDKCHVDKILILCVDEEKFSAAPIYLFKAYIGYKNVKTSFIQTSRDKNVKTSFIQMSQTNND